MTDLTKHCVSLELAKELAKNGYPQDSLFWWHGNSIIQLSDDDLGLVDKYYYAAPISSEIGERLPNNCLFWKNINGDWPITWHSEYRDINAHADTAPNTAAKLWLQLKTNNLLPKD